MSDEARIERLTELARRAFGDEYAAVHTWAKKGRTQISARGREVYGNVLIEDHPRALDALEAALLVLAGESAADDVVTLAEKLHGGPLRTRMMALASDWEARAKEGTRETAEKFGPAAAAMGPVLEALVHGMAEELRERARQP